ncbi:MAG: helix-turn-helix transcriptional regulator [Acinetobacter sp.]
MHRIIQQGDLLSIQQKTKMLQLAEPFNAQLEEHFYHIEFLLRRQISDQLLNERCIQLIDDQSRVAYLFLNLLVSAQEKLSFGTRPLVMLTLYQPQNNEYHSQLFKIFDCFSTGVILLTHDQKVFYQNAYASQLLEKSSLLNVSQKHVLKAQGEFQNKLSKLLLEALADDSGLDRNLVMYGQDQQEILTLNISAIDQNAVHQRIGEGPKVLAVFFKQLNQKRNLEAKYLKQLYQLTPREIQVCMHFFQGLDLAEIAEVSHLTLSTVRTYLKQIYLKTHCSSQSELMKLLMNAVID